VAQTELDAFLADPAEAAAAPPEAPQAAPAAPEAPTPPPEAKAAQAAVSKPEEDTEADPPAPREGDEIVPRNAYEAERRRRQDWKERAVRHETEAAELRKQLDELKRAAAAPPPQAPVQPLPQLPDPNVDPIGYIQQVTVRQQQAMLNERLNFSEMMVRDKIGPEKLDGYVTEFKRAMETDPTLGGKLASQAHPYAWLVKEVDRLRVLRDVGDDPASFRERLVAEARAQWEAEASAPQQPTQAQTVIANMPRSLATARSVASRSASVFTGDPSLQDVLGHRR